MLCAWFNIEKLNLTNRLSKIKLFFQNRISWTDVEGDKVTIRTNEELIIALAEMKGPVYKLTIEGTSNFPELVTPKQEFGTKPPLVVIALADEDFPKDSSDGGK